MSIDDSKLLSFITMTVFLFPIFFSISILFYFIEYYDIEKAFLFYLGLFLSLAVTFLVKFIASNFFTDSNIISEFVDRKDLKIVNGKKVVDLEKYCNIIETPFINKNVGFSSLYTTFYGYLIVYFIISSQTLGIEDSFSDAVKSIKVIMIITFTFFHIFTKSIRGCITIAEIVFGLSTGIIIGLLWVNIIDRKNWDSKESNEYRKKQKKCTFRNNKFHCLEEKNDELKKCKNNGNKNDIFNQCKSSNFEYLNKMCQNVSEPGKEEDYRCIECIDPKGVSGDLQLNLKCKENQVCQNFKCVENPNRYSNAIVVGGITLIVISLGTFIALKEGDK